MLSRQLVPFILSQNNFCSSKIIYIALTKKTFKMSVNKKYFNYLFVSYILLLLIATVMPWSTNQKFGIGIFRFRIDYWLHFAAYFGLAFLFIIKNYSKLIKLKPKLVIAKTQTCLNIAFLAEFIQWMIPYRSFNIKDFLASSIGIVFSYVLFLVFRNRIKIHKLPVLRILFSA